MSGPTGTDQSPHQPSGSWGARRSTRRSTKVAPRQKKFVVCMDSGRLRNRQQPVICLTMRPPPIRQKAIVKKRSALLALPTLTLGALALTPAAAGAVNPMNPALPLATDVPIACREFVSSHMAMPGGPADTGADGTGRGAGPRERHGRWARRLRGPATAAHHVRPLRPRHRHLRRESRGLRDPRHQGKHPAVPEVQSGRGAQSPTTSRSCSLIRSSRAAASSRGTAPPSGTGRTTSR